MVAWVWVAVTGIGVVGNGLDTWDGLGGSGVWAGEGERVVVVVGPYRLAIANKYRFIHAWIAKGREHTCVLGKVRGCPSIHIPSGFLKCHCLKCMRWMVMLAVEQFRLHIGAAEMVGHFSPDVGPAEKDREWRSGGLGVMAHKVVNSWPSIKEKIAHYVAFGGTSSSPTFEEQKHSKGIYETKIGRDFNTILRIGCVCKVDKSAKKRNTKDGWDLNASSFKVDYVGNTNDADKILQRTISEFRFQCPGPAIAIIECPDVDSVKSNIRALEDFPCVNIPSNA
ncbi:DNA polymerase epsilon catalytic subunit, partial [Tanacetum coccineum]